MERTASGALLWARASLLASVAFFGGVVGHVSADGLLPSPLVLIGLLALGIPFCASQLTRQASMRRIVLLLMAGQTAVHVALSVTAGHRGETRPVATVARSGDLVLPTEGGQRVGSLLDGYQATVGHTGEQVQPALPVGSLVAELAAHGPMMVAHLAAAALVGIWLAVGERSLWALVALATAVVLRPLLVIRAWRRLAVTPSRPAPVLAAPRPRPSLVLLARCVSRRGPPALLA
jgi:hypothetical protein